METLPADRFERFNIPLDSEGNIVWDRIAPEKLVQLEAGPGLVRDPAEQEDFYKRPAQKGIDEGQEFEIISSEDYFRYNYNNFPVRFIDGPISEMLREEPYYRRLRILFPTLEAEARDRISAYRRRIFEEASNGNMNYNDPACNRFMQFTFGIMTQLIDSNDLVGGENIKVKDSINSRVMLTV